MNKRHRLSQKGKYVIFCVVCAVLLCAVVFLGCTERHYSSAIDSIRNGDTQQALDELDHVPEWYREQTKIHQYIKITMEYEDEGRDQYRETAAKVGELSFSNGVMESVRKVLYNKISSAADKYDADLKTASNFDKHAKAIAGGDLDKITLEHKEDIIKLYQQYDDFDHDVASLVTQGWFISEAKERIDDIEASNIVISKIDAIGEVTLEKKDVVSDARDSYTELSEYSKKRVTNLATLENAEKQIQTMEEAQAVVDEINGIGDVDYSDGTRLRTIRDDYNNLSDDAKKYVSNYSTLTRAEDNFDSLRNSSGDSEPNDSVSAGTYYYVSSGSVYHVSRNCPTLSRSKHVISSSSKPSNRHACKVCA